MTCFCRGEVLAVAYLAAQVRHLVPDLRWLCSLCGGPLYCHLLHPEVLHVFPTILRKHPNLRTSCYADCYWAHGHVLRKATKQIHIPGEYPGF